MGLQAKVWTALESTCFGEQVLSFFYNLSPGADPECGQISAIIDPVPPAYRGLTNLVPGFHTSATIRGADFSKKENACHIKRSRSRSDQAAGIPNGKVSSVAVCVAKP